MPATWNQLIPVQQYTYAVTMTIKHCIADELISYWPNQSHSEFGLCTILTTWECIRESATPDKILGDLEGVIYVGEVQCYGRQPAGGGGG